MNYQDEHVRDREKFEFFKANPTEILAVFDARLWGGCHATVPQHLQHQSRLALLWGTNLPTPIPDLRADAEGISGHLSFNTGDVYCAVPWRRVYVLLGSAGARIWPLDVPISVRLTDLEQDYGIRVEAPAPAPLEFPVAPPQRTSDFEWLGELSLPFGVWPEERRAGLRVLEGGRTTPRPSARRPSSPRLRSIPGGVQPVQNLDDQFPDPPRRA